MLGFDDLPPGTVLPPLSDDDGARLQQAQDTGQLHLADVDEAELAALGLPPLRQQGRAQPAETQVAAAAQRLVARSLAELMPWPLGRVRPAGNLLLYTKLLLHAKARTGDVSTWVVPEQTGSARTLTRVNLLMDVTGLGLACVETAQMSADDRQPVALSVDVLRLDVLVSKIVSVAFGDDAPPSGGGRETLVLFADATGAAQPTRLRLDAAGTAELETSRRGVLGPRTVRERVAPEDFADHLKLRLMSAGTLRP